MSSHCYMLQKKLQLQILQLCLAHYSFYTCTYMYMLYQEVGTIQLYRKIVSDMIKEPYFCGRKSDFYSFENVICNVLVRLLKNGGT